MPNFGEEINSSKVPEVVSETTVNSEETKAKSYAEIAKEMGFNFDQALNNQKIALEDLEKELEGLSRDNYFKVGYLPKNIQKNLEDIEKCDENKKYSKHIEELRNRLKEIVEKYNLDKDYFLLKEM